MKHLSAILVFGLLASPLFASGGDEIIEALKTEYAQWQSDIGFTGSFKTWVHAFAANELPLYSDWDWSKVPGAEHGLVAEGFIAKKGEMVRIRYEPRTDPVIVVAKADGQQAANSGSGSGGRLMTNAGADEITNHRLSLRRPATRTRKFIQDAVSVDLCATSIGVTNLPLYCTTSTAGLVTPVRPLGTFSSDPFQMTGSSEPVNQVAVEISLTEDASLSQYIVSLVARRSGWRAHRELRFQTSSPHRFISSLERYYSSANADNDSWTSKDEVFISDFVGTQAAEIPRRIRSRHSERGAIIRQVEFYSADLGNVAPKDDDFVYPIDSKLMINGLKRPEKWRAIGKIDLQQIGADELVDTMPSDSRIPAPQPHARGFLLSAWFALFVGISVAVPVVLFVIRGGRKQ